MISMLVFVEKDSIGMDTKLFFEERDEHEGDYLF